MILTRRAVVNRRCAKRRATNLRTDDFVLIIEYGRVVHHVHHLIGVDVAQQIRQGYLAIAPWSQVHRLTAFLAISELHSGQMIDAPAAVTVLGGGGASARNVNIHDALECMHAFLTAIAGTEMGGHYRPEGGV